MVVNVGNQSKWRWAAVHSHWIVKKKRLTLWAVSLYIITWDL